MKQILRKTFLVLAAGIMSSAAWATTTIVGAEDNSDAAYYANDHYARYTLEAGKTISIEFTVSTSTADGWNPWFAWAINFWDGELNAITVEARNYGWEDGTKNTRWTSGWAKYWEITYPSGWETGTNFRDIIQGATIVATVKRVGADVVIIYDITTTDSKKYRQYVVKTYGDGTRTLTFDLIVNHTHITIDNEKTKIYTENIQGTLLGVESNTGGFGEGTRLPEFTVAPNGTLRLHFKNYTSKIANYMNWCFEMQYGDKYCDVVTGGGNWGDLNVAGTFADVNWPTDQELLAKMDGADVVLTVTRSGSQVSINAVHTPVSGTSFTRVFSFTPTADGFATANVTVRLLTDHSHIDLISSSNEVYATIGSKGWTTFSNADYALNFASVDGLTAYQITDQTGKVITKSEVTSAVQKNTGLLLNGTAGTTYTIPVAASGTALSGNKLVAGTGSAISMASGHTYYVLTYEDGDAQFKKLTSAIAVPVGKAYLDFPTVIEARSIDIEGDGTTGINMVNGEGLKVNGSEVYYDLQGRRVLYPKKGLYIVSGKKVILK